MKAIIKKIITISLIILALIMVSSTMIKPAHAADEIEAGEPITKDVIDSLNPLIQQNSDPALAEQLSTPGGAISRFLGVFAFPIAGLILFVMLIWGGVEMMAGSATSKSVDAGKQRVTTALLGFLLLFASFWIARILEMMFGIKIL